jgi:phytanoyl-CoA hydroxylase
MTVERMDEADAAMSEGRAPDITSSDTTRGGAMTNSSVPKALPPIDVEAGGDYPDGLYSDAVITDYVARLSDIGPAEIERFRTDGYLAVRSAVSTDMTTAAIAGLRSLMMSPRSGADLQFESWAADRVDDLDAEQRMDIVRKLMWFVDADERLGAVAGDKQLLAVIARLLGDAHVTMFQDMALLKPPGGGREKPWHQDKAYFNIDPSAPVVGVWIALDEATLDNGCMHVMPGSHREGPVIHFRRRDWQICDTDVNVGHDVAVPLPPGGALIFDGLLHHGTPANRTNTRRRALQFHYRLQSEQEVSEDEHLAVYGGEGRGATC